MKKVLFILTLVLTLVLPCSQKVFAGSTYYEDKDYYTEFSKLSYEDQYDYACDFLVNKGYSVENLPYVLFTDASSNELTNNPFRIIFSEYPFTYDGSEFSYIKNGFSVNFVVYDSDYNGQILVNDVNMSVTSGKLVAPSYLVYSNYDLCDSSGNVVVKQVSFPRPPVVLGVQEPVLVQAMTQENPLKEILTILPMVIPCWVGFVALRKALRLLATILRTA